MIDFDLTEDERLVQRSARQFAVDRLKPAIREHERSGVPAGLRAEFRELGFDAVDLNGPGALTQVLLLEELAAVDVGATLALDATAPARYVPLRLGAIDDARALLSAESVALIVDLDGALDLSGDRLSGCVAWCPVKAPSCAVVVRPDGALLFDAASFRAAPVSALALDAAGASEIRFEGAQPSARWTGDPSRAMADIYLYAATLLTGLVRGSYEYVSRYAQDRVTFGLPLAQHQAVAFLIVEMAMAADASRLATWRAARAIATSEEPLWAASAALSEAAESALTMTNRAVQLLGGHGYMKDHPVEKWMREARALTLAWGGPDALSDSLARTLAPTREKADA